MAAVAPIREGASISLYFFPIPAEGGQFGGLHDIGGTFMPFGSSNDFMGILVLSASAERIRDYRRVQIYIHGWVMGRQGSVITAGIQTAFEQGNRQHAASKWPVSRQNLVVAFIVAKGSVPDIAKKSKWTPKPTFSTTLKFKMKSLEACQDFGYKSSPVPGSLFIWQVGLSPEFYHPGHSCP